MSINIIWIVVVVSVLIGGIIGFKRGLVEGIMRLVTTSLGIVVLVILAKGIGNFLKGSYVNVLMAIILLAVLHIFHRIGKLIIDSCKLVSKLPVIHSLDKVAGMILGYVEVIFFVWLVFLFAAVVNPFGIQEWLMEQVNQSVFLSLLYKANGLILILQNFLKI